MALSGSYDFTVTRDDIIKGALRLLGVIKQNHEPDTDLVADCAEALNLLLKSLQAEQIGLWLNKEVCLFLDKSTSEYYDLGPSGDHCTLTPHETTASAAASTGDSTISVTSASNITDGDYIGIELEDGTMQWTTVDGTPSGTTVTLDDVLTDDVDSGATVFNYTEKIQRPLQILEARIRNSSDNDTPLSLISRNEYMDMSDKDSDSTVVSVYYDPQLTNGRLYVWPISNTVKNRIYFTAKYPIQDLDSATDNIEMPAYWLKPIKFLLAIDISPEYFDDVAEDRMKYLVKIAEESKRDAQMFDSENTSIFFQPDLRY